MDVAGLSGNVEVLRDAYGVPQIYADTAEDLFAAQGFVHAQDRFYEMDFRRHLASGRLSELYGESQVETDAYIRTLGWRRVAEAELALLAPSSRRYLDAYASGVNAYLTDRSAGDLSLEYTLLGLQGLDYEPQPWTAVDSLAWLKVMAWDLGSNLQQETERAILTSALGAARATVLYPSYPREGHEPIVSRGAVVNDAFDPDARRGSAGPLSGLTGDQLRRREWCPGDGAPAQRPAAGAARLPWLRCRPRLQLLGAGRLADRQRPGHAVQRPAPRDLDPVAVRPGRPALPGAQAELPVRRHRIQPDLPSWCGDRQEQPRSPGG